MSRFRTDFRRARGTGGWTLVELLITVGILVAATGSLVEVMSSSSSLTSALTTQGDLREHSRHVVDVMVRELRWADTSTLVVTQCNGSSKIRFRTARGYAAGAVVWSPTITYEIADSNVDSNHDGHFDEGGLVRIEGSRTTVLSSNVPAGGFSAVLTSDNLQIDLRLSSTNVDRRAVTTTASAAVTLRNKSS